jgi:hypothetical protein
MRTMPHARATVSAARRRGPRLATLAALFALGLAGCRTSTPEPRAVASAMPSAVSDRPAASGPALPKVCGSPWSIGVVGGGEQVVVICSNDVRRTPLASAPQLTSALSPGLDPVRDRVCGCATRLHPPPFIDLVFTAKPEEGTVTVEAKGDDDESDPQLGPPFVACTGSLVARFAHYASAVCSGGGPATLVYPVRLELEP